MPGQGKVLVDNPSAHLNLDGQRALVATVPGRVVLVLQVVGGVAMLALAAGALALVVAGRAAPSMLGSVAMAALFGGGLLALAARRRRRCGTTRIDGEARTLSRLAGGYAGRTWRFDQVRAVRTAVDPTDGTRLDLLPGLPAWLVLVLDDGTSLWIAKGGPGELGPVRALLGEWGLG